MHIFLKTWETFINILSQPWVNAAEFQSSFLKVIWGRCCFISSTASCSFTVNNIMSRQYCHTDYLPLLFQTPFVTWWWFHLWSPQSRRLIFPGPPGVSGSILPLCSPSCSMSSLSGSWMPSSWFSELWTWPLIFLFFLWQVQFFLFLSQNCRSWEGPLVPSGPIPSLLLFLPFPVCELLLNFRWCSSRKEFSNVFDKLFSGVCSEGVVGVTQVYPCLFCNEGTGTGMRESAPCCSGISTSPDNLEWRKGILNRHAPISEAQHLLSILKKNTV